MTAMGASESTKRLVLEGLETFLEMPNITSAQRDLALQLKTRLGGAKEEEQTIVFIRRLDSYVKDVPGDVVAKDLLREVLKEYVGSDKADAYVDYLSEEV